MSDFDRTAEYAAHHSEEEGVKMRKTIWAIFWVLLAVTTVEVGLGLVWKDLGLAWPLVKWTFIILTLVKAYYIVAYYMHLKHEYKNFKMIVSIPYIVLTVYFIILMLIEAIYLNEEVDHLLM
ncbi:MAG: caa(3)-type oxidase [Flavobacteriales bacterium]|nr:caa(3)-type oxidase [Flavobacteriales bacterium]|tara:strand:- start:18405 stop:18770 length:366 start_codon:yes stop_codon:yes gene_type:complete